MTEAENNLVQRAAADLRRICRNRGLPYAQPGAASRAFEHNGRRFVYLDAIGNHFFSVRPSKDGGREQVRYLDMPPPGVLRAFVGAE